MEIIIHLFERTLISSLEASLMVVLLLMLLSVFRRKLTPAWRYALWILLIIKLLLPLFPGNLESDLRWIHIPDMVREHIVTIDPSEIQERHNEPDQSLGMESGGPNESVIPSKQIIVDALPFAIQLASIVWLLGIAATVLYVLTSYIKMSVILWKEAAEAVPSDLQELFTLICKNSGIRSRVRLKLTNVVSSPTLFGLLSPIVLIPKNLVGKLNETEWECVFQHELTHFKRMDVGVNMIFVMLAAVHWFNPVIWYGLHRMRIDQEVACDSSVLTTSVVKEAYASCIVKVLEIGVSQKAASASVRFSGYKNQISRRIVMIRTFQPTKKRVSFFAIILLIAVALFALPSVFAGGEVEQIKSPQNSAPIGSKFVQSSDEQSETNSTMTAHTSEEINFIMPTSGRITSLYGERIHPKTSEKSLHDGIDIANEEGTDVVAAAAGTIIKAEYDNEKGFMIIIEHNEKWQTEYRHFSELSVKVEDAVESGDRIGLMGSTGQSTGPHLHFSIVKNSEYIDPISMLEK